MRADPMVRKSVWHPDDQAGFTLLELVVVVGVIATIMGVLVLGIRQASDAFALRKATTLVISELRRAHAAAMANDVNYLVELDVAVGQTGSLGLRVFQACPTCPTSPVRSIRSPEWPSNVQISSGSTNFPSCPAPADTTQLCATFTPLGYLPAGGRIRLKLVQASGDQIEIDVALSTGQVSASHL